MIPLSTPLASPPASIKKNSRGASTESGLSRILRVSLSEVPSPPPPLYCSRKNKNHNDRHFLGGGIQYPAAPTLGETLSGHPLKRSVTAVSVGCTERSSCFARRRTEGRHNMYGGWSAIAERPIPPIGGKESGTSMERRRFFLFEQDKTTKQQLQVCGVGQKNVSRSLHFPLPHPDPAQTFRLLASDSCDIWWGAPEVALARACAASLLFHSASASRFISRSVAVAVVAALCAT